MHRMEPSPARQKRSSEASGTIVILHRISCKDSDEGWIKSSSLKMRIARRRGKLAGGYEAYF